MYANAVEMRHNISSVSIVVNPVILWYQNFKEKFLRTMKARKNNHSLIDL